MIPSADLESECFHFVTRLEADGLMNFISPRLSTQSLWPVEQRFGLFTNNGPGYPVKNILFGAIRSLRDESKPQATHSTNCQADADIRKIKDDQNRNNMNALDALRSGIQTRLAKAERRFQRCKTATHSPMPEELARTGSDGLSGACS